MMSVPTSNPLFDDQYCFVVEGKVALPYQYFAGATGSRFIIGLRDEKKIYAVRSRTGKTFVPPRKLDERTFEMLGEEWFPISGEGTVENFTVVRYREPYQPMDPPYILAVIRLDGADTPLVHIVHGVAPEAMKNGLRVKAVFADESVSNILALRYFVPLETATS